ncbi:MAG: type II toxin-antitoxin system HipA family toxin [Gammaproteobacteria bacterium]|nr:type II toxin-antitoxin system HipA family toxin [Gammaproteobacteria bacterium]
MTKTKRRDIEVYAHWVGLSEPTFMGILYATPSRGEEVFSFEYDENWLRSDQAHNLDPSLQLYSGIQYAPQNQNFSVFLDSSPDRWGRTLMDRREAQLARQEGRINRNLLESDYLLGVYDEHRIGGLRFRTSRGDDFLDNNKELASPPWTSLRELEQASWELEKEDAVNNSNYSKWLQMLITPGSSLGGARPKASVIDEDKHLWIAKFPSSHDDIDIGVWEMVVNNLAQRAGIITAQATLRRFNGSHHTFLSKRFDRTGRGERIHYASALTLLQRRDGHDAALGASYLELAEFLIQNGSHAKKDLEQLWRRIIFFICISNTDDHLRNHSFILQPDGWVLSPAYDINPVASGNGLKLNINETDNSQDIKLALEVSEYFRLKTDQAGKIVSEVIRVVKQWRQEASMLKVSTSQQDRMARAFRIADEFI